MVLVGRRSLATNRSLVLHAIWLSIIGHRRSQGLTRTNDERCIVATTFQLLEHLAEHEDRQHGSPTVLGVVHFQIAFKFPAAVTTQGTSLAACRLLFLSIHFGIQEFKIWRQFAGLIVRICLVYRP